LHEKFLSDFILYRFFQTQTYAQQGGGFNYLPSSESGRTYGKLTDFQMIYCGQSFNPNSCLRAFVALLVFVLLLPCLTLAQPKSLLKSKLTRDIYGYDGLDQYKRFLDSSLKESVRDKDKNIRKIYREIVSARHEGFLEELADSSFLFDSEVSAYLNKIFQHVVKSNQLNQYPFHFFVSRTSLSNAYCTEDGTIVCNLGLLSLLETESQIALVFSHEIAHYLLKHPAQSLTSVLEKYQSDEFISELKSIKREKYNTRSKLETVALQNAFNVRRHNRAQETAADSLGIILYLKTGYSTTSIPRVFDLLDESQEPAVFNTTLRAFLEKENIATNQKWFEAGKTMTFGKPVSQEITESLATHPDCKKRKLYAINYLRNTAVAGQDFKFAGEEMIALIKKKALDDQILFAQHNKNMSLCLYQAIQGDALYSNDIFISTILFGALVSIADAQKNHILFSVIDKAYQTEDTKDEYAKLLKMLETVSLSQIISMADSYYQKNKTFIMPEQRVTSNLDKLKQL
jgi:Zn-dependent protease with chaperone function